MHKKETKMIAKFDYKEKLALGCLYMKDKFLIQDRDDQISYPILYGPYWYIFMCLSTMQDLVRAV